MLDARKKAILFVAVQEYILTAEPVGSHRLVEKYQLGVSSATVRNELAALESMGYLHQPHTSAGRLPTDLGYRFYVDSISDKPGLTNQEETSIARLFSAINMEMEELMRETTQILSDFTNYIAVALTPSFTGSSLKHIDLVELSPRHALVVLITDRGQVLKRVVNLEPVDRDIAAIERLLNERLQGLRRSEITQLKETIQIPGMGGQQAIATLIDAIIELMANEDKERVVLSGTTSIFGMPEFEDLSKVQGLLTALEHGYRLMQWLEDSLASKQVLVRIGSENPDLEIRQCSLVARSYQVDGETLGTLGIIGPTRMNYARAISAVQFISDNLTKALIELRS